VEQSLSVFLLLSVLWTEEPLRSVSHHSACPALPPITLMWHTVPQQTDATRLQRVHELKWFDVWWYAKIAQMSCRKRYVHEAIDAGGYERTSTEFLDFASLPELQYFKTRRFGNCASVLRGGALIWGWSQPFPGQATK
jgi:hypothetical protein